MQDMNCFVINFEDLGTGSNHADLVFNPIYFQKSTKRKFFGEKYVCVREEFRRKKIISNAKSVVITFGGVDPKRLTLRLLKIFEKHNPDYRIFVIIGNEFVHKKKILMMIKRMQQKKIKIKEIVKTDSIAEFIDNSMFAITANGRTVFEIATRYVPVITISVNKREEMHKFSQKKKIGYHLGLYSELQDEKILNVINKMEQKQNREKFQRNLKQMDLKNSIYHVKQIINLSFNKWINRKSY